MMKSNKKRKLLLSILGISIFILLYDKFVIANLNKKWDELMLDYVDIEKEHSTKKTNEAYSSHIERQINELEDNIYHIRKECLKEVNQEYIISLLKDLSHIRNLEIISLYFKQPMDVPLAYTEDFQTYDAGFYTLQSFPFELLIHCNYEGIINFLNDVKHLNKAMNIKGLTISVNNENIQNKLEVKLLMEYYILNINYNGKK